MRILLAGRISRRGSIEKSLDAGRRARAPQTRGVTLMELLIVMAIIGLLAGVSFPAITAGLESIKLTSATDSLASFLNGAVNRAERRQQAIELIILPREGKVQ